MKLASETFTIGGYTHMLAVLYSGNMKMLKNNIVLNIANPKTVIFIDSRQSKVMATKN